MSDTKLTPISFSACWTDELGEEIKRRAMEQCPDGYNISVHKSKELSAIVDAWNQGIDSHLEAITQFSTYKVVSKKFRVSVVHFNIYPKELHVLVRRLMESDDDKSQDLASFICSTLDIELV